MKMHRREERHDRDSGSLAAGKLPEAEVNGVRYLKLPVTLESG